MDFLFSIIAFIVLVGILVAIHEYGLFIAAKLCNVKVLRYSIGFGKVLMSRRAVSYTHLTLPTNREV